MLQTFVCVTESQIVLHKTEMSTLWSDG